VSSINGGMHCTTRGLQSDKYRDTQVAGRPKKTINPAGTSEIKITVPNETRAFLEAQALATNMPIGRLVRRAVETHLAVGDRLEKVEADMK